MADLDNEAEPIVAALMRGTSVTLAPEGQALLARWALKVAYMAEFLHPAEQRHTPPDHRRLLRAGSFPPDTYVYAAAYNGIRAGWHRLRTFDIYDDLDQPRIVGKGYALTFILGRLALRVLGYPGATGDRPTELDPELLAWERQILPRVEPVVVLPPLRALRDGDLYRFTDALP